MTYVFIMFIEIKEKSIFDRFLMHLIYLKVQILRVRAFKRIKY